MTITPATPFNSPVNSKNTAAIANVPEMRLESIVQTAVTPILAVQSAKEKSSNIIHGRVVSIEQLADIAFPAPAQFISKPVQTYTYRKFAIILFSKFGNCEKVKTILNDAIPIIESFKTANLVAALIAFANEVTINSEGLK